MAFVLVVVAVVVVLVRTQVAPCRDELVSPRKPLLSPTAMEEQPDPRLDRLAAAVEAMEAPFGEVLAGVGYDYDQWLSLYGIEGGVLAFTKNNAPVTLLDGTDLEPRWSLRPASKRIAWDAAGDRFLLLDLSADTSTRVSSYDVQDGERVWCAELDQEHREGDPVSTTFLDDGDVLVALPDGDETALTRLSDSGGRTWSRDFDGVGRADYLGQLGEDLVLVGGTEEFRLAEQDVETRAGSMIRALEASDGNPAWSWSGEAGSLVHVVGVSGDRVIVTERSSDGVRLFALSDDGEELWSTVPEDLAFEATLRNGMVVMKSRAALYGYDSATGSLEWEVAVPTDRTFFPYGFTLGQMPSLDDDRVLVPTTTELVALDVRDGSQEAFPLPVDGISTTYWPYQLLATPDLLGVVTNTGGVVARRE